MDRAEQVIYDLWVILGDLCIAPGATGDKKRRATEHIRHVLDEAAENAPIKRRLDSEKR